MQASRATWFLTHRCNLACSYCATIKAPQMTPEVDTETTLRIAEGIVACAPEVVIVTGGEATMHPDFAKVVWFFNGAGQEFVVITNATRRASLDGVTNLSCSVDVEVTARRRIAVDDAEFKSGWGLKRLREHRDRGGKSTASIVITAHNFGHVPRLVATLSEEGIASMVGVIHLDTPPTIHHWRMRAVTTVDDRLMPEAAAWVSDELVELKRGGARILNDESYLRGIATHGHALDWHCTTATDLVVDSDGSVLTCSDWWGPKCKDLSVLDARTDAGRFLDRWRAAHHDDNQACPGCFWNCSFQAESESSSLTPGRREPSCK